MEPEKDKNIIPLVEALLFLENRPVNIGYISKVIGKNKIIIRNSIAELGKKLKESGSSLEIIENGRDDFHLTISPTYYQYLGNYYDVRKKFHLSKQSLETLAIVAYRQPVTKVEIEKIRGVQVGHTMKVLLEQGLIRIVGRKNTPGKPVLYSTTDKFLKCFGLLSLNDLPPIDEFDFYDGTSR